MYAQRKRQLLKPTIREVENCTWKHSTTQGRTTTNKGNAGVATFAARLEKLDPTLPRGRITDTGGKRPYSTGRFGFKLAASVPARPNYTMQRKFGT